MGPQLRAELGPAMDLRRQVGGERRRLLHHRVGGDRRRKRAVPHAIARPCQRVRGGADERLVERGLAVLLQQLQVAFAQERRDVVEQRRLA